MLFIAGTGLAEILDGSLLGLLICIGFGLLLVFIAILAKFFKLVDKYANLVTLLVMFGFNCSRFYFSSLPFVRLSEGSIYTKGYSFASLQIALIARFFEFKQKVWGVLLGLVQRIVLLAYLDQTTLNVDIILKHIAVDVFIIYIFYSNEKQERQVFRNFYQSREGLVKFKELLTDYFPQSLTILNSNITKPLFSNKKFLEFFSNFNLDVNGYDLLMEEPQPDSKVSLDCLKVDKNTIREIEAVEPHLTFPNSVHFRDIVETIVVDKSLNHKAWALSASYTNSNSRQLFEVTCKKIQWEEKNAVAVILSDITYQEHLFALKTADANKDKILATVSHELRTPLSAITSILEICETKINDKQVLEYIRLCKDNATLLFSLVNSLLDLHQINQGKFKLNPAPTDLRKVIKDMINLFTFQAKNNAIHLDQKVSEDIPLSISTDENRLKQILINLIGNALKFTFSGSITIEAIQDPDNSEYIKISVCDTGIGIAEEDQKRLFRIYGKLEDKEGINKNGVGLGLTISKTLVEALSGKKGNHVIEVQSKINAGTRFSFIILKNLECFLEDSKEKTKSEKAIEFRDREVSFTIDEMGDFDEHFQFNSIQREISSHVLTKKHNSLRSSRLLLDSSPQSKCQTEQSIRFKKYFNKSLAPLSNGLSISNRTDETNPMLDFAPNKLFEYILVVDDNPFNILVAENLIKASNFNVLTARSGQEAIEIAKSATKESKTIKIILMDCQMPIMDGFETTKILKSLMEKNEINKIPIVALTANCAPRDIERCYESGMNDYLCKPLLIEKLYTVLNKLG